jgi:hypothetical protein
MSAPSPASTLAPPVEQALAALAADGAQLDREALEALVPVMDALLNDDRPAPARCEALTRGVLAVLGPHVARALTDDTHAPAHIAARFFRLRQLSALADVLAPARR